MNELSMIERMARALCQADGHDPDRSSVLSCGDPFWTFYRDKAKRAVAALREPTEVMIQIADTINEWEYATCPENNPDCPAGLACPLNRERAACAILAIMREPTEAMVALPMPPSREDPADFSGDAERYVRPFPLPNGRDFMSWVDDFLRSVRLFLQRPK